MVVVLDEHSHQYWYHVASKDDDVLDELANKLNVVGQAENLMKTCLDFHPAFWKWV